MKITKRHLRRIIKEAIEAQEIPTPDEIEEWWTYMSPGSIRRLSRKLMINPDASRWNAKEWEAVTNYYVQVEMGDSRGYQRGRNI